MRQAQRLQRSALAGADIHGSIHGDTPAPHGLTFQILKITSPNEGTMRFCKPTNSPSPALSGVGIRVLTFR
jgi:hypothetical protein